MYKRLLRIRVRWIKRIVVLGGLLTAFFIIAMRAKMNTEKTLRLPIFIQTLSQSLHPEKIDSIEQYTFINVLFSPLVLFDNSGRIEANLATQFYWEDEYTLVFQFDRIQKTLDGYSVGADDALLSLKRMILLNGNLHGSLAERMEIPTSFRKLNDEIPNLFVKNGKLHIRLKKHDFAILHILASADYAVIPAASIDKNTFEIVDFKNTSGPYYLSSEDSTKAILLQNKGHFRLSASNAGKIVCLKYGKAPHAIVDAFLNGVIDHIPTASPISSKDYIKLAGKDGTTLHQTRDIMLYFGLFTEKARLRFSPLERIIIADVIGRNVRKSIGEVSPLARPTDQFFHEDGVGHIADDALKSKRSQIAATDAEKKLNLKNLEINIETSERFGSLIRRSAEAEFKKITLNVRTDTLGRVSASDSDIIFTGIDVGLKEDFTGLSFAMELGVFPLSNADGRNWITKLSRTENSQERASMIESLQSDALLNDPTIIPLYRLPAFAIAQNDWQMDLPKLWVTERIWQIYKK